MAINIQTLKNCIKSVAAITEKIPTLDVEFNFDNRWTGAVYSTTINPIFKNVTGVEMVANICESTNWLINSNMTDEWFDGGRGNEHLVCGIPIPRRGYDFSNFRTIKKEDTKDVASGVKYHYETVNFLISTSAQGVREVDPNLIDAFGSIYPMLIDEDPVEIQQGGKSYRVLVSRNGPADSGHNATGSINMNADCIYAVSTDHKAYNFLDKGHTIFFISKAKGAPQMFITNQVSLNVYLFALLYSCIPDQMTQFLRAECLLYAQNSAELQRAVATGERLLPQKFAASYNTAKQGLRNHFNSNAQNILVSKFQRQELSEVTLNNIKFSTTGAKYETISIEADDFATVIFNSIDPNSVFDIYQLADAYIGEMIRRSGQTPLNTACTGFEEAKAWTVLINNIAVTLSVTTTNTRRKVNGHYINNDELAKVMRRATCFQSEADFDRFLRQIERASLRVHDALANGVPLKIFVFDRYADYHREVTNKHPKIFFTYENGKYYLWTNKERTTKVPLRRFVGLLDALKSLNGKTDNGHIRSFKQESEGGHAQRNSEWCRWKLKEIILQHAVDDKDQPLITREALDPLVEWLLEARTEAEKKSKQLLDSVVAETEAKAVKYKGVDAYEIVGSSGRSYTVEKENFKVWDTLTDGYVCIVDGRGEMGVGYDALVARLLALRNDTLVVDRITTLKSTVAAARSEAAVASASA